MALRAIPFIVIGNHAITQSRDHDINIMSLCVVPFSNVDYRTEKRVLQILPTSGTRFTVLLNWSTAPVLERQFESFSKKLLPHPTLPVCTVGLIYYFK